MRSLLKSVPWQTRHDDEEIVALLNRDGLTSSTGKPFTVSMISWIRYKHRIPSPSLPTGTLNVSQVRAEIWRQYVGRLLLDRRRPHNSTEEEARPAIRHHDHRRDRSQTAGLGCQLFPHCHTIPQPELNKVHYAGRIPTVADRIAQEVVRRYLEPILEPVFHTDSYGYRPGKSAIDAVRQARQRCWRHDWVLDIDIKGYLDAAS